MSPFQRLLSLCLLLPVLLGATSAAPLAPPVPVASASASLIESVIPAGATGVGRVDLNRVLETELGARLLDDLSDNYRTINWLMSLMFGFKLREVDNFWFVSGQEQQGALFLRGQFRTKKIERRLRKLPGGEQRDFAQVPVAVTWVDDSGENCGEQPQPRTAAILSDQLIAIGDEALMKEVLGNWQRRAQDGQRAPHPGILRVLESSAPIAFATLDDEVLTESLGGQAAFMDLAWGEIHLDSDMQLSSRLESGDEQVGRGVEMMLQGLLLTLERHPGLRANPAALAGLRNGRVRRDGSGVLFTTRVDGDAFLASARDAASEMDPPSESPAPGAPD